MALTNLGQYITQSDRRNSKNEYGENSVVGLSTQKEMIETKADLSNVNFASYKLLQPNEFAYVPDTSRRGDKVSLAYNRTRETYLVSSISIVFRVEREDLLNPEYLFMYFNRPEFDRYARFNSWGSAREAFSWEDMCDIELELPPIEIQQKYVDIYNAMLANQKAYEQGLDDLKLTCDAYFDKAKKGCTKSLRTVIEKVDRRNSDNSCSINDVRGITNNKVFSKTKADVSSTDLTKFKMVMPNEFAYNSRTDGRDKLVLALNREKNPIIVTFNYNVFKVKDNSSIVQEYLYALFKREEFDRLVRFNSWGSSQELLSWSDLCEFRVPSVGLTEQLAISKIINSYNNRKEINEKLKAQIKDICPILIKGSLEEARKND